MTGDLRQDLILGEIIVKNNKAVFRMECSVKPYEDNSEIPF